MMPGGSASSGGSVKPCGSRIVLTGFIGDAGVHILVRNRREALLRRFSASFLHRADENAATPEERLKTAVSAVYADIPEADGPDGQVHYLSEGGLYTALWHMAKAYGCGFRIPQHRIPVHQETIEVCNFFDIDPYGLYSAGCALLIVPDERKALRTLYAAGIPAACIGELTKDLKKVLLRKDEERFLARPKQDVLKEFMTEETDHERDPA